MKIESNYKTTLFNDINWILRENREEKMADYEYNLIQQEIINNNITKCPKIFYQGLKFYYNASVHQIITLRSLWKWINNEKK